MISEEPSKCSREHDTESWLGYSLMEPSQSSVLDKMGTYVTRQNLLEPEEIIEVLSRDCRLKKSDIPASVLSADTRGDK
ncbi:unnamed protein product [Pleuronectes platessa]|uniref:Uncharacterized protein n=1 Tax=Pleuronectes platessa TaxID=8262 RepID=A0A9N7YFR7_PLEPL|nr:unnamed protein product [Pleuronectes platessa]